MTTYLNIVRPGQRLRTQKEDLCTKPKNDLERQEGKSIYCTFDGVEAFSSMQLEDVPKIEGQLLK